MSSPLPTEFEFRTVLEKDKEQIFEHMNKYFFIDEPLCLNFGLLADDGPFREDLNNFVAESLREPSHSLVILHEAKVVGVALNEVYERNKPVQLTKNSPKSKQFEYVVNILDYVKRQSNLFEKFPNCNKILLLKMLSVDTSYRGKGLAKILIDKSR